VASMQGLIVALLVLGCTCYAAWKLMPSVARRSLAAALLRIPHLPAAVQAGLHKNATATSGCGCDGCDHAGPQKPASKTAGAGQPITFHPRTRR
jgi:hypothetical protein